MKQKKKFSIRMRIAAIGLSCWLIPFLIVTGMLGHYIISDQMGKRIQQRMEQLQYNTKICAERLNNSISASRTASYEGELKKQWRKIDRDFTERIDNFSVLNKSFSYLTQKYKNDTDFQSTIFWFEDSPENLNSAVYNGKAGGSYQQIQTFWQKDFEAVHDFARTLDTSTGFFSTGNRIYMVRNLMDGSFHTFGTLVMRLNLDYLFGSLLHMEPEGQVVIQLNDMLMGLGEENRVTSQVNIHPEEYQAGYSWENGVLHLKEIQKENSYTLNVVMRISKDVLEEPIRGYLFVLIGMVVILFPIMGLLYGALKNNISIPVEELMRGSKKVEEGELGYHLAYEPGSTEFQYLVESFNRMSERLKYQFDHIYQEELALRDARIMALQSHINPHFLNNTLEIINWEARLEGNIKISKMIESLSALMNAAMDRKKLPEVQLQQELEYVDAYLYIMKERLVINSM